MKKAEKKAWPRLLSPCLVLAGSVMASSGLSAAEPLPQPPDVVLAPLFQAVQAAKIYPDQKTFADAQPLRDPSSILADWQMQKQQRNFDLKRFLATNFTLSADGKSDTPPPAKNLREHIDSLWPMLTRSPASSEQWGSLLPLPKPYVVPGGRFNEIYYWDSYFTMLGLAKSDNWQLVQDMTDNFAWLIDQYGHIPNGNRSYYLSRSQPPFFSMMVDLLAQKKGDEVYRHYLPQLKKEYDWWMAGANDGELKPGSAVHRVVKLKDGTLLNRYWDERDVPRTESWMEDILTAQRATRRDKSEVWRDLRAGAASGWDFSSRWFDKPNDLTTVRTTAIVPVDLNSLLWHLETTLAKASALSGNQEVSQRYTQLAQARQKAINHFLWDKKQQWYADYDWKKASVRPELTAATVFPLYMQLATPQQAADTARAVEQKLLKPGGLSTTTLITGQQWDAPNGWAPLQWAAVSGFNHYGNQTLARKIGLRFLNNVQNTWNTEHKLVEKYVVEGSNLGGGSGGEYPLQDGFGWTNGVTMMLLDLYCPQGKKCNNASEIPETDNAQP